MQLTAVPLPTYTTDYCSVCTVRINFGEAYRHCTAMAVKSVQYSQTARFKVSAYMTLYLTRSSLARHRALLLSTLLSNRQKLCVPPQRITSRAAAGRTYVLDVAVASRECLQSCLLTPLLAPQLNKWAEGGTTDTPKIHVS